MAHRDQNIFICSGQLGKVICRFCNTICGLNSAARHRRTCRQFIRFKNAPRLRRLKKLKRLLDINTTEICVEDGAERACVGKTGRYVDRSELVGDRQVELNLTIESIFRHKWRRVRIHSVEEAVASFMPGTYVKDRYICAVLRTYCTCLSRNLLNKIVCMCLF
jgi:hypothetical protein